MIVNNKPLLRFQKFDSSVWSKAPLITLLEKVIDYRGQSVPKAEFGIPLITARNVREGYLDFTHQEYVSLSEYKNWATRGIPTKGDILFTTEAPLGKVCRFPEDQTYAVGQRTISLRTSVKLSSDFLLHFLLSPRGQRLIDARSSGTTAKGIRSSEFKKVVVTYSENKEEQIKISAFLTSVDTKISQLTEKHRLLKEYKKGVMQQIFSQQICFRDDDGEAFPKWTENRLDYFIERVSNPVDLASGVEYREIGIRSHGKGIFHKNPVTSSDIGNKRVFWVKEKALVLNIVFAWERAVAVTSDSESGFIASHRFPMYLPKENRADVKYLLYFLLSPKGTRLLNIASPGGAGRNKTLGQSEFAKLKVCLPSLKEQQKIAQFLQSIDTKIEGVAKQVEQTKLFKKGLLQQMFV